tara:strand:+ start:489 stop:1082 length:594 start_codon:yes stop_codon:yes gene_type:complete
MDNFNYQAYLKSGKLYNEDKQIISENEDPVKEINDQSVFDFANSTGGETLDPEPKKVGKATGKSYVNRASGPAKVTEEEDDDVNEIEESSKMKVSELKAKIREDIISVLSEQEDVDVDVDVEDEVSVDAPGDDVEIEKKAVKAKIQVGLSPEEELVQDSLEAAMKSSEALGDDVLTDQIGNTITYFTRKFVVGSRTD